MVKERVAETHTSEGDREVGRALGKAERVSLHRISSEKDIEAICREVISRVDGVARLVRMTPARLESLKKAVQQKVKKNLVSLPESPLGELELNEQSGKIRKDWDSRKWRKDAPHGWAWRQEVVGSGKKGKKKEVVALVYETREHPDEAEIFLDREILIHPRGALALIKNMNKRHKALMSGKKKLT